MKRFILLAVTVLIIPVLHSQTIPLQKLNATKSVKEADYLYNIGSYYNAEMYYEAELKLKPDNVYATYQIAMCNYFMRDYQTAEDNFRKIAESKSGAFPLAPYYYGLTLKANSKYDLAKSTLQDFLKNFKGESDANYKRLAANEIKGCDLATQLVQTPDSVKIIHLNEAINTPFTDFAPQPLGDTALMFASLRADSAFVLDAFKKNDKLARFYLSRKTGEHYDSAEELDEPFNNSNGHVGNGCFSADRSRFYFTRCEVDPATQKMVCKIYESDETAGEWSDPVALGQTINFQSFTATQPCIGVTRMGEVLFWVSDRPGGSGGTDVWYSIRGKDGNFTSAINAGRTINTPGDEVTPFYDNRSGTLYFSSNGQVGIGGYDVFKIKGNPKKWDKEVTNMGYPLNSSVDDMYFVLDDNEYTGYLVSNRIGTTSLKGATCCDDIWRFEFPKVVHYVIKGNVYDQESHMPLQGVRVMFLDDKKLQVAQAISRKDTLFSFNVIPNKTYFIKAARDGYLTGTSTITVTEKDANDTMNIDLNLKKIPVQAIRIYNVYYGFDSASLKDQSFPSLDTLVDLMKDNPEIVVEISSHTDSKGKHDYNIKLSQARAQSVVDYMISKGIASDRLKAQGYGETQPVAPNTLPNGKDNPAGRALNRRTEFKVVGEISGRELIYEKGTPLQQPDQDTNDDDDNQK